LATLPLLREPNTSPGDLRKALEAVQDTSPDFAWLGVADRSGRVRAGTRGLLEGQGVDETLWHRAAIRGQAFAGPPREIPELSRINSNPQEAPHYVDL